MRVETQTECALIRQEVRLLRQKEKAARNDNVAGSIRPQ
jgi:hypothetical protein